MVDKAKHYRSRAGEIRTIAQGLFDHKERKTLLAIALEYEELALRGDVGEGYMQMAQARPNGAGEKPG